MQPPDQLGPRPAPSGDEDNWSFELSSEGGGFDVPARGPVGPGPAPRAHANPEEVIARTLGTSVGIRDWKFALAAQAQLLCAANEYDAAEAALDWSPRTSCGATGPSLETAGSRAVPCNKKQSAGDADVFDLSDKVVRCICSYHAGRSEEANRLKEELSSSTSPEQLLVRLPKFLFQQLTRTFEAMEMVATLLRRVLPAAGRGGGPAASGPGTHDFSDDFDWEGHFGGPGCGGDDLLIDEYDQFDEWTNRTPSLIENSDWYDEGVPAGPRGAVETAWHARTGRLADWSDGRDAAANLAASDLLSHAGNRSQPEWLASALFERAGGGPGPLPPVQDRGPLSSERPAASNKKRPAKPGVQLGRRAALATPRAKPARRSHRKMQSQTQDAPLVKEPAREPSVPVHADGVLPVLHHLLESGE